MKRKALIRGLLGFPEGIAVCLVITIVMSLAVGDGYFHACAPEFAELAGSELAAVVLQTLLSGLVGSVYGAASVIWELERWSIPKQSGVFFAVAAAALLPAGWLMHWMERSAAGIAGFLLTFFAAFAMLWLVLYFHWRRRIRRLNRDVENRNRR